MSTPFAPEADRVTMGERYGRATDTTDLRLQERRSDADILIAAGWLDDNLGAKLFRLGREFDLARGEHGIAEAEFERMERAACDLERQGEGGSPEREDGEKLAADLRKMAEAQALSARCMVLMHLKSLGDVKETVFGYACSIAKAQGFDWDAKVIAKLVGQVLDIHLDPSCHHCQGRGFSGGYLATKTRCRECRATGRRGRAQIGKDQAQRAFGGMLLDLLKSLLAQAAGGMAKALRDSGVESEEDREAAVWRLTQRLAELRSPAAQAD